MNQNHHRRGIIGRDPSAQGGQSLTGVTEGFGVFEVPIHARNDIVLDVPGGCLCEGREGCSL